MKKKLLSSTLALTLFLGCVGTMPNGLNNGNSASLEFQTNTSTFLHQLSKESNQEDRNAYMDEYFFNSDMQCQHYLNKPLSTTPQSSGDRQLYMNIFDTVSAVFGMKYLTDIAKASFTSNNSSSSENKEAYQNALSPEIREGVKIGRLRYARELKKKQPLPITKYSTTILLKDLKNYDRQCNLKYGLIEINRALRASQNTMNQPIAKASMLKINPRLIKAKVEAVSKEVKRKEEMKKAIKQQKQPSSTVKPPKPSTPVSVQPHHDILPNLPRSPQIVGE